MGVNNKSNLINSSKLRIFIDSQYFSLPNKELGKILNFSKSPYLEMIRSPHDCKDILLNKIPSYKIKLGKDKTEFIEIDTGEVKSRQLFGYKKNDIIKISEEIYKTKNVSVTQFESIKMVFVQACFNSRKNSSIFITENEIILKNRLWFESHFPGGLLNIMSLDEAILFLDLFFKSKKEYFITGNFKLNKGFWYWLSMRTKLPHYNVDDNIVNALANRVQFALMALDEIGIQYYSGVNNDIMSNTEYHFNYLISLITGIFDNLAIKTNNIYNFQQEPPSRISLSKSAGRDFKKKIKNKNPKLFNHINRYQDLIEIAYSLREIIIHRETLEKSTFQVKNTSHQWESNVIEIPQKTLNRVTRCGDKKVYHLPFTSWGAYVQGNRNFIIPYYFSKELLGMILPFVDEYLLLIGYSSFVKKEVQKGSPFSKDMDNFENLSLGF